MLMSQGTHCVSEHVLVDEKFHIRDNYIDIPNTPVHVCKLLPIGKSAQISAQITHPPPPPPPPPPEVFCVMCLCKISFKDLI